ncbi:protein of unknown function [Magnetospirillum gryphiswaldense MSR-1 v2]|uniref:Uncharacterized protein n=1 Tax=Magnetospirillum gryphiswaldense (strain DSM 6361 / JCM 21280 / NBRC 15271 / MSR-1) TaxID=431944 RepID=V6EZT1_MAGGM|nr:protein of unknown function [Magnetospirillum gryphiswaldense MSR-1 v2]
MHGLRHAAKGVQEILYIMTSLALSFYCAASGSSELKIPLLRFCAAHHGDCLHDIAGLGEPLLATYDL